MGFLCCEQPELLAQVAGPSISTAEWGAQAAVPKCSRFTHNGLKLACIYIICHEELLISAKGKTIVLN